MTILGTDSTEYIASHAAKDVKEMCITWRGQLKNSQDFKRSQITSSDDLKEKNYV